VAHAFAGADGGQAELGVEGSALGAVELDLEGGALGGGPFVEQLLDGDAEGVGERRQQAEPRLASTVLDEGELAGRGADSFADLVERHAGLRAEVSDALAERGKILHGFTISKESAFFA